MALVEAYGLPGAIQVAISGPTIQAVDDPESTFYVLRRPGLPDVHADWPHPLHELCPEAIRIPAWGQPIPRDVGRPVTAPAWEPLELTPEQREASRSLRIAHLHCEDCGKRIEAGDYQPLDLFRHKPGASGKQVWDATKEKWVRRPAQGPKKRARRDGRRFKRWDLCTRCAEKALLERQGIYGRDRLRAPKRGGRPRLLTESELRAAHKIYEQTGMSRREIAKRLWQQQGKGSWSGYDQSLLYGWRRLKLKLRPIGEQIAISRHGSDGSKSKHWKKRCKRRLRDGRHCTQYVRRIVTATGSHPADDGLCWNHARQAERRAAKEETEPDHRPVVREAA